MYTHTHMHAHILSIKLDPFFFFNSSSLVLRAFISNEEGSTLGRLTHLCIHTLCFHLAASPCRPSPGLPYIIEKLKMGNRGPSRYIHPPSSQQFAYKGVR